MRVAHKNRITTPPKLGQVKIWLEEKYTNFKPKFLDELVNRFFGTINEHTEYSKKRSIKYIQDNLLKWDRIYRKQELSYWTNRGWSDNEASNKRIVRNKDWYIKEYGSEDGLNRYNKKCYNISKNSGHSLEKFIIRYGEKGGAVRYDKYKENCKRDLPFFIEKYGAEDGVIRYTDFLVKTPLKTGYTLDYCIKKYGKEIGVIRYDEFLKKIAPSKDNFIRKYGPEDGIIRYNDFRMKTTPKLGIASKESLKVFKPIKEWLNGLVDDKNIYLGDNKNKEYFIRRGSEFYFYDFTILDLNVIIEYNGIVWHANPKWDDCRLNEWYNPYSNETYKTNIDKFNKKIKLANTNGFDTLVLWSDTSIENNIEKCKEFILNKL